MDRDSDKRLRVGRTIIMLTSVFMMVASVVVGLNPLPGEEAEFCRVTFQELESSDPRMAQMIWHLNTAVVTMVFGASVLVFLLAWRSLSNRSILAWYAILTLNLTFISAQLIAHLPIFIKHGMHFNHWFLPFSIILLQSGGLAITKKPVFRRVDRVSRRDR